MEINFPCIFGEFAIFYPQIRFDMKELFFSALLIMALQAAAQPEMDIYLFQVNKTAEGYSLGEGKNITPRRGYDNQPYFTPDSRGLLYVAADSRGQTDVFLYQIEVGSPLRLTRTKKRSEYSPKVMPGAKEFSVVTVEEDSTQRLWSFPLEKEAYGEVLMPEIDSIGYYAWYKKKKLAMFMLTNPPTLQRTHRRRQKTRIITDSIGRCIWRQSLTDSLSFVKKDTLGEWYICNWHPWRKRVKRLCMTRKGREDFCWTPEGQLLMGDGQVLYIRDPYRDGEWRELARPEVGNFDRIAMSPDGRYLALVVSSGE